MADQVLLGPLPGGGDGLRIARPGYNVLDVNLPAKHLAFDSRVYDAGNLIDFGHLAGGQSVSLTGYSDMPFFLFVQKVNYGQWAGSDRFMTTNYAIDLGSSFALDATHPGGFYLKWRP